MLLFLPEDLQGSWWRPTRGLQQSGASRIDWVSQQVLVLLLASTSVEVDSLEA